MEKVKFNIRPKHEADCQTKGKLTVTQKGHVHCDCHAKSQAQIKSNLILSCDTRNKEH